MSDEKATVTRHVFWSGNMSSTTHFTIVVEEYGTRRTLDVGPELAVHLYRALGRVLTDEEKRATA